MKRRLLIIDDESVLLLESRKLVQDHGVQVDIAETIEEAMILLQTREYEFVIVGIKFSSSLQEKEAAILKSIKEDKAMTGIILLTGCGGPKTVEEALAIGAAYYHEKRVSTKILTDALKNVAQRSLL